MTSLKIGSLRAILFNQWQQYFLLRKYHIWQRLKLLEKGNLWLRHLLLQQAILRQQTAVAGTC